MCFCPLIFGCKNGRSEQWPLALEFMTMAEPSAARSNVFETTTIPKSWMPMSLHAHVQLVTKPHTSFASAWTCFWMFKSRSRSKKCLTLFNYVQFGYMFDFSVAYVRLNPMQNRQNMKQTTTPFWILLTPSRKWIPTFFAEWRFCKQPWAMAPG